MVNDLRDSYEDGDYVRAFCEGEAGVRLDVSRAVIRYVCPASQHPKSAIKEKTHKGALWALWILKNASTMFDNHTIVCRINKPFACSRCVICVSRSVHVISTYYARKVLWTFLITHKSMTSNEAWLSREFIVYKPLYSLYDNGLYQLSGSWCKFVKHHGQLFSWNSPSSSRPQITHYYCRGFLKFEDVWKNTDSLTWSILNVLFVCLFVCLGTVPPKSDQGSHQ